MAWESNHFGFPVLGIGRSTLGTQRLPALLWRAQKGGARLVCWPAAPDQQVPASVLADFRGRLVDRKVTYRRHAVDGMLKYEDASIRPSGFQPDTGKIADPGQARSRSYLIGEYQDADASPSLTELALIAATHSRFFRDPGFPRHRAEALYQIWIARSVRRELASVVLIARPAGGRDDLHGMVTVVVDGTEGRVGLIAVRPDCQGCGVGRRLMEAAHGFMVQHEVQQAVVVTQADNIPACKLYEQCGYRVASLIHYYHFWVGGESPAA